MSESAKDEDELVHRVADTLREYVPHINFHGEAIRAIAAIRAAGWAVVPANLTLPMMAAGGPVMRAACGLDEKSATMNTINDVWRAMIAAAPGVKP